METKETNSLLNQSKEETQLGKPSDEISDNSKQTQQSKPQTQQPQQTTLAKKSQKPATRTASPKKPKLPSLHESCKEGEDNLDGPGEKTDYPENVKKESNRKTYFGVKSYLHQFYENRGENFPGDEEDFHYLIRPKGRSCGAILFKIGLITGATLFLLGAVAIIIGYAIPTQDEERGRTDEFKIMDRNAMRFNRNLDMSKLAGLAMFCSGGLVLVISLLAPTFTSSYWEEDLAPEGFKLPINLSPIPEDEPTSPIPATEKITGIQPIWTQ